MNGIQHRQSDEFDFPEDQEVTNIVIQSTRKMTDHVLYQICVSNSHKRASFRAWTVLKRFTQFYEMDLKLRSSLHEDLTFSIHQLSQLNKTKRINYEMCCMKLKTKIQ